MISSEKKRGLRKEVYTGSHQKKKKRKKAGAFWDDREDIQIFSQAFR